MATKVIAAALSGGKIVLDRAAILRSAHRATRERMTPSSSWRNGDRYDPEVVGWVPKLPFAIWAFRPRSCPLCGATSGSKRALRPCSTGSSSWRASRPMASREEGRAHVDHHHPPQPRRCRSRRDRRGDPAGRAAGAHLDAELLALREPFYRTWRAYEDVLAVHSTAEGAAWSLPRGQDDDAKRRDAERRHDEADAIVESTGDANREIVDEMCRRPARTIEGLAFKARVSLDHEDNLYPELVTSIMDDIVALGGAHA